MTRLKQDFTWGTLKGGFAVVEGVFRDIHPRYSRGGAVYVSSHGAIVTSDYRLPFGKPLKVLAPLRQADQREAALTAEGLAQASAGQIAMADLSQDRYALFEAQTGLFRRFAAIRSAADVLAFSNRYGPLGADLSVAIVDVTPEEPWKMGTRLYWAEPVSQWLAEAKEMARVVSLWELIRAGREA